MTEPVIQIRNVSKSFRNTNVLDELDLSVSAGETFAFLGRNGAGKTTTIKLMMGLLTPDSGELSLLGVNPVTDAVKLRSMIGYLAEDQTMYDWMRVDEIIRFVAPFYPTWDQKLANEYVKQFALPVRTRIKHLSKGQTVRLGLVLALSHRPELVILDDPALGLDPIMRRDFNRDLVTHLQAEGRTVLYSSHLLYEVEAVADTVAILHEGKIVRTAATEDLRRDVKRFTLSPQDLSKVGTQIEVLDGRLLVNEVSLIVDGAPQAAQLLEQEGISCRISDLNLDEIFEAFVMGDRKIRLEWPEREPVAASSLT
ncbi:putative ABC transporter ATP-binding protein YxlF [Thalassoglobus neptunius]|uniref:Putative ABC transporter ATP-binding protein YxlF n=1 Tax=Thalassoglobus neptunius TaxID=1938619 RepID=A0A5C5W908_9PLAN|nr:ABC transporter ATP-binding protein [Thalassoglobus neptunius]TWT47140.1 putative ABC transporter ATP-binding protein YxlF [Thalassoglobus neptunius]